MARLLLILIIVVVGGISYLAVRYAKDSYKILPMPDAPAERLEATLDEEPDYQNWQEFSPPSGAFKILLPVKPQHVSDKSSDPKTHLQRKDDLYIAEKKNGNVFMIHFINFHDAQEAKAAEDELLQNFMNDMLASNPNNKLVASQPSSFKGKKGLDFVIENDDFSYDVREFLHENNLIVLSSVSRKTSHNPKDFEFFINSFEFSAPEKTTKE